MDIITNNKEGYTMDGQHRQSNYEMTFDDLRALGGIKEPIASTPEVSYSMVDFPLSENAQTLVGTLTYKDSGEVVPYTDSQQFVTAYQNALDTMGPNGARVDVLTPDIETHYRIATAIHDEFGETVNRDAYFQLAQQYGFEQPWPKGVMYHGTDEEWEIFYSKRKDKHFESFVSKVLHNPAADLEFHSYDNINGTFTVRHWGGPESYIESMFTPEELAHNFNFSEDLRTQFFDMDYINPQQRLFVDMDGTLAEFKQVDRLETLYEYGYFANLQPMENVVEAVREIISNHSDVEVFILSSYLSDSSHAQIEKNQWLDQHLPEIDAAHRIFAPCGADKKDYVPGGIRPTDCLLDDYTRNLLGWEPPAKGIKLLNGINHTKGTWQRDRIWHNKTPAELAESIVSVVKGREHIYDHVPMEKQAFELGKRSAREMLSAGYEPFYNNGPLHIFQNRKTGGLQFYKVSFQPKKSGAPAQLLFQKLENLQDIAAYKHLMPDKMRGNLEKALVQKSNTMNLER